MQRLFGVFRSNAPPSDPPSSVDRQESLSNKSKEASDADEISNIADTNVEATFDYHDEFDKDKGDLFSGENSFARGDNPLRGGNSTKGRGPPPPPRRRSQRKSMSVDSERADNVKFEQTFGKDEKELRPTNSPAIEASKPRFSILSRRTSAILGFGFG